jgi:hypothetical protein
VDAPATPAAAFEAGGDARPEDPEAELDRAEAELMSALGQPGFAQPPGLTEAQPGASPPPPAPPLPAEAPAPAKAPRGEETQASQISASPCATACRALASMVRSADHLCGLAGEGDARCEGARTRVKNATERVQAQCPACAQ